MFHPFGRHAREFARAIGAGEWQRTSEGILFPRHGALLSGAFGWTVRDATGREVGGGRKRNYITAAGLTALRTGVISSGGDGRFFFPLFVSIYGANLTPGTQEWTDYYYATVAQEYGDGPEGYSEINRPDYVGLRVSDHLVNNSGTPATFTVVTSSQLPVYGFALHFGSNGKRDGLSQATPFDLATAAITTEDLTSIGGYDVIDPYLGIRNLFDGGINNWFDLSADDYFDLGAGQWTDPFLDDALIGNLATTYAIVRSAGVSADLYNNSDVITVTYDMQFGT